MHDVEVLAGWTSAGRSVSVSLPPPWEAATFRAMGTVCAAVVIDGPVGLAAFAEAEVERCEARWSRFRGDSELCRLNANAGRGFVVVSRDTFAAVERAVALWRLTDGWFDPTVHDALVACGYDQSFELVRARSSFQRSAPARPTPGCAGIDLDNDASAVRLPAGVQLDLGGIGKGLAADIVAERVIERGARGVCVELGGDIRVRGIGPDGHRWNIDVENPFDENDSLFTAPLDDDAIVTSSRLFRRWPTSEGEAHHLIDPTTGWPAGGAVAAVVARARDAWYAEGIAKAALVAGRQRGAALASRSDASCWFVLDSGEVVEMTQREPASC